MSSFLDSQTENNFKKSKQSFLNFVLFVSRFQTFDYYTDERNLSTSEEKVQETSFAKDFTRWAHEVIADLQSSTT